MIYFSGSESAYVFIFCLYMYRCWRSSYEEVRVGIPLTLHVCVCPKPNPALLTSYVMVFLYSMNSVEMRGDWLFCSRLQLEIWRSQIEFTVHSNAILNIKMYSGISLGLKITKFKIPGNIVERLWHIHNVTSYEDFQFKT